MPAPVLIQQEDAAAILFHFAEDEPRQRTFVESLVVTIQRANRGERNRLRTIYPGLVTAFDLAVDSPTGLDTLAVIAKGVAS